MLRRLKRYKHANMRCIVAKHKTDSRFADRDALPDFISTHDEVNYLSCSLHASYGSVTRTVHPCATSTQPISSFCSMQRPSNISLIDNEVVFSDRHHRTHSLCDDFQHLQVNVMSAVRTNSLMEAADTLCDADVIGVDGTCSCLLCLMSHATKFMCAARLSFGTELCISI